MLRGTGPASAKKRIRRRAEWEKIIASRPEARHAEAPGGREAFPGPDGIIGSK